MIDQLVVKAERMGLHKVKHVSSNLAIRLVYKSQLSVATLYWIICTTCFN